MVEIAYGRKGFVDLLLKAMVEHARENGVKILPLCTFAGGRFDRTPEYADVLNK
ncbi:N-acetyltransferase [Paenibacillus sp. P3E]|uniref:N-acetyltransferase n=1 Tax=Paenibacillus sp. P3E TaxID=1349435 RepID=UPI00211695DA|nr:N-acetyltransferase [Paenibacillus sp. P3E]